MKRQPQPKGLWSNHVWDMDFVSDVLFDGRRLRLLTVIGLYTRECLGICVGQNLRSAEVAEMLNTIALRCPLQKRLKIDNGLPFESTVFAHTDNTKVESFNSRLRQKCLNENWFISLELTLAPVLITQLL
ncbi:DDE-type integrase/transposase/recombinase [Raoultella sp. 18117]|uniref:DDE-type integrase/transposase/recombinase n=1 Tax=unclassified Raoultella TaxID=2627600 RepID=UPI00351BC98B